MSEHDEDSATIIPFPSRKAPAEGLPDKISLTQEDAYDLILAISSVNMATKYQGEFEQSCKDSIEKENFPCTENCGCYLHMLSSMALEIISQGPRKEQASNALRYEHETLKREGPKEKDNA